MKYDREVAKVSSLLIKILRGERSYDSNKNNVKSS